MVFEVSPIFSFGGVEVEAWVLVLALLAIIAVIAIPLVLYSVIRTKVNGERFVFTTRDLTFGAVCLALSYALSFFGLSLPAGGTITFASILPVAVFCYFYGLRKSVIIATVYMLLQLTQGPYIVSVWSMLLDYILPYFALSLIGAFSYNTKKANKPAQFTLLKHWGFFVGMLIYVVIRYASHVLSGMIFWETEFWASMAYNAFCLIDTAIAAVCAVGLLSSKALTNMLHSSALRSQLAAKSSN